MGEPYDFKGERLYEIEYTEGGAGAPHRKTRIWADTDAEAAKKVRNASGIGDVENIIEIREVKDAKKITDEAYDPKTSTRKAHRLLGRLR